jgi:hypothetical protein
MTIVGNLRTTIVGNSRRRSWQPRASLNPARTSAARKTAQGYLTA